MLVTGSILTQPPASQLYSCEHLVLSCVTCCTIQLGKCQRRPYLAKLVPVIGHWLYGIIYDEEEEKNGCVSIVRRHLVTEIWGPDHGSNTELCVLDLTCDKHILPIFYIGYTAGLHRKPIVGPRNTVTMGNDFSAEISATRFARGFKCGPCHW